MTIQSPNPTACEAVETQAVPLAPTDGRPLGDNLMSPPPSEDLYRSFVVAIDEGFALLELIRGAGGQVVDARFLEVNPAFETIAKLKGESVIGHTVLELNPHPEPRWLERCVQVVETGEPLRFESQSAEDDRWFEISLVPRGGDRLAGLFTETTARKRAEAALRASEARQTFLLAFGDAVRNMTDARAIMATAARRLGEYLGADRAGYAEVDETGEFFTIQDNWTRGDMPSMVGRHRFDDYGSPRAIFEAGQTLVIDNAFDNPQNVNDDIARAFRSANISAVIAPPLIKDGRFVALLFVHQRAARQWTTDEVALVQDVAERTWSAVERARAERAVADDLSDTRLLRDLSLRFVSEGELPEIYDALVAAAMAVARSDTASMQLLDPASGDLLMLAARGFSPYVRQRFQRIHLGDPTSCGQSLASRVRAFVDFDEPDRPDPDGLLRLHREVGIRSAQSTPLVTRSGRLIGMLSTHWHEHHRSSERELRLLDLLARQAADLIEQRQSATALRESEVQLRETQQRLQLALTAGAIGTWVWDIPRNDLRADETLARFFGLDPVVAATGLPLQTFTDAIHPEDRPHVVALIEQAVAAGSDYEAEYRVMAGDDAVRWLIARGTVERDQEGQPLRFPGTVVDITRLKQLEQQREEFIGIAAHELRTPVTSIKAHTQALERRLRRRGDTETADRLGKLDAQLNRLSALINDLLEVARLEAGHLALRPDWFDVDALVTEVVDAVQFTADRHHIAREGQAGQHIWGDRERIGQVLTNLLTNGIKYSPEADSIVVRIATDASQVAIAVQDFGVGIARDQQAHLFERFYRVNDSVHAPFSGMGLGLYVSSEIIRRHGGRLSVKSDAGQGSTFTFALPCKPSTDLPAPPVDG